MQNRHRNDAVIVGAGPGGLCAALFLSQRGARVEIVDEHPHAPEMRHSVLLHPDSLSLLRAAGVTLDPDDTHELRCVTLHDERRRRAFLELSSVWAAPHDFAAVVPAEHLLARIEQCLAQRRVQIHRHHRLARIDATDGRVSADIDELDDVPVGYAVARVESLVKRTRHREPRFLIGADGSESVVRRQLGAGWSRIGEPTTVIDFEVEESLLTGGELRLTVSSGASAAAWPLPQRGTHLSFRLPALESGKAAGSAAHRLASEELGAAELGTLARLHAPWAAERALTVRYADSARIEPHLAGSVGRGPVWLIGDAASLLETAASQALNHTVRAASELAGLVSARLAAEAEAASRGSGDADDQRSQAARAAAVARQFEPDPATDPWIAAHYAQIVPLLPGPLSERRLLAEQLGLAPAGR